MGPQPREADYRNLLPQQLGFAPGTSLIGSFGTTAARFQRIPFDGSPEPSVPGPGAHAVPISSLSVTPVQPAAPKWSWGTGPGHALVYNNAGTPGPGAYGEDDAPGGGMLTHLRRQWPGIATMSSFGSNATLPTLKPVVGNGLPGPGAYDAAHSAHFVSNAHAAHSPYIGAARGATGSRLQRDLDSKQMAVFASGRPAHVLPGPGDASGSSLSRPAMGPGPSEYNPKVGTIGAQLMSQQAALARRRDGGTAMSFASKATRFGSNHSGEAVVEASNPGPGAHTVPRWRAEKRSYRKPDVAFGRTGFLSSSERFAQTRGRAQVDPEDLIQYLASGEGGAVGQPVNAQAARRKVAEQARSVQMR
jgi:hypothetical protein